MGLTISPVARIGAIAGTTPALPHAVTTAVTPVAHAAQPAAAAPSFGIGSWFGHKSTTTPTTPVAAGAVTRETYDAQGRELDQGAFGKLIRKEGDAPVKDDVVNQAHDNAKVVYDFYKQVLGRDSLDGKGMTIKSTVHFGSKMNNAFWDGEKMAYGDGDGKMFAPLTGAIDVVGHEMTHAVTEHTAGLDYSFQPGALNESWSDVMGELIEQWHESPADFATPAGAQKADWMIGEDVFTPGKSGDALRSLKAPGTAYSGDQQPGGNMKDYKKMSSWDDNGGVHINSGIPNHAAYEAAVRLGGEKVAKIWYKALTDYLKPEAQFADAAWATISAAKSLYTGDAAVAQAVTDAWKACGITPSNSGGSSTPPSRGRASGWDEGTPKGAPKSAPNPGIVPPWLTSPAGAKLAAH